METELKRFCDSLLRISEPLFSSLDESLGKMKKHSETFALEAFLSDLATKRADLRERIGEIRQEETYLVIFGPLKSGKSVLMNSISGAYVSEVSSLPAYPCLVHVRHGEEPSYSLTLYDGTEKSFESNADLQREVSEAHVALAEKIRFAEAKGEIFEPEKHHPEAIRQVDVELPSTELEAGSAVIVDTPGLYARMRFGYDRMTRRFRDRAACAIFVVRPENLFLEQVFNEFDELLGFFSRIFFVVNVDQSKKDLTETGSLRPSLESTQPDRIIEAFESLSMNAVIREAYRNGRLKVYPIDLLEVGKAVLTEAGLQEKNPHHQRFQSLTSDLQGYLNGSDYTKEFIAVQGRRFNRQAQELGEISRHPGLASLENRGERLRQAFADAREHLSAVDNLREIDWEMRFKAVRSQARESFESAKERLRGELVTRFEAEVASWMSTDESLADLRRGRLASLLEASKESANTEAVGRFQEVLQAPSFGVEWSSDEVDALVTLDAVPFSEVRDEIQRESRRVDALELGEPLAGIPVRRSFWDWLLLRGAERVRRSVFGAPEDPGKPVPARVKERRLGERAKEYLIESIEREWIVPLIEHAFAGRMEKIDSAARRLAQRATDILAEIGERSAATLERTRQEMEQLEELTGALEEMKQAVASFQDDLSASLGNK